MGFYNSGGLITRGYGDDHRIVTRGYSVRFDFGGINPTRIKREHEINLFTPVLMIDEADFNISSPVEINKDGSISIDTSVKKEVVYDVDIQTGINYAKLSNILDII